MAGSWVSSCLDSVLAQTVTDFELVISDNCSSDDTFAICQSYAARDGRIRIVRQGENIGIAANHNFTYLQATAPYFCWLSANDIYDARFLERCLDVLEGSADVVLVAPRASNFLETPGDGELYAESPLPDVHDPATRLYAVMSSTLSTRVFRGVYRRSAIGERAPLKAMFGNDHLLVVELSTVGRIVQIGGPLYYERISAGARTASIPLYRRARYYEPHIGIVSMLFHRVRIMARYWVIAMGHAQGLDGRLAAIPAMLRVTYDLRRMPLRDLREAWGLLREGLRRRLA
jgi:glycosyltransferase involved in cell wall biosynthesis